MTLVELLIAISLGGVLLGSLASLTVYTGRSLAGIVSYVDLDRESRNTLDLLTSEVRQADAVLSYSTNQLVMTNKLKGSITSYTYNPVRQTLVRTNGSAVTTNLTGCEAFTFAYYMDVTMTNSFSQFEQYLATGTNNLRMIQASWQCYRKVMGQRDTESVQSAKILIRKH